MKLIPYGRQFVDNKDKKILLNSLSNDLITTGPLVQKFEKNLSNYIKCKYSFACSSGTAAIHLAMLSIGLKKNDNILMPAINFISSYNMAKNMDLNVFLVDVDQSTGQITPNKILQCIKKNKLKKIKAVITMYLSGYPLNIINFYKLKKNIIFLSLKIPVMHLVLSIHI